MHNWKDYMTIQDIVAEIPQLTIEDRLVLLDAITQSLRVTIVKQSPTDRTLGDRLFGAFKTDGPALTDEDVDQIREEALREKYL